MHNKTLEDTWETNESCYLVTTYRALGTKPVEGRQYTFLYCFFLTGGLTCHQFVHLMCSFLLLLCCMKPFFLWKKKYVYTLPTTKIKNVLKLGLMHLMSLNISTFRTDSEDWSLDYFSMSFLLPKLSSKKEVDQAIKSTAEKVLVLRFGRDEDPVCLQLDDIVSEFFK